MTKKSIERREQLLGAALKLFSVHGFEGVSTYAIAEEAGVTEGLIFHYFPKKLQLFQAVIERFGFTPFHHIDADMVLQKPPLEGLALALNSFLDLLWTNRMVVRLTIAAVFTNQGSGGSSNVLGAQPRQRLNDLLASYEAAGTIKPGMTDKAAKVIFSACAGFLFSSLREEPEDWETTRSEFVGDLVSVVMGGLISRDGE